MTPVVDHFDEVVTADAQLTVGGSTISCSGPQTRSIAEHWISGFPRIADGKITEAWEDWDEYGMRKQLSDG